MLASIRSAAISGIDAIPIEIEVDLLESGNGHFWVVGLPDASIKESEQRINSALVNCGFARPYANTTVNLAPADLRKEGASFDLPIALGILACMDMIPIENLRGVAASGELALDGRVRPVKGSLSIAMMCRDTSGIDTLLVPEDNAPEAALVEGISVIPIRSLPQALEFLNNSLEIEPLNVSRERVFESSSRYEVDMSEVKGQQHAKRALEIAAAGGHNIILVGNPGSGKTMLARRFPTILPPLTFDEAIQTTRVHSVAGLMKSGKGFTATRPYRSPHHTVSNAGLIGGGANPVPGEVSVAHNGVLFLDELPEFQRNVLEVLRQPLEDGYVTISRVSASITYPANFMLIAAMNPCPCGFHGDPQRECTCTPPMIKRYRGKISGPLMDRIDLQIPVPSVKYRELSSDGPEESSGDIRRRVVSAREIQHTRFAGSGVNANASMNQKMIKQFCALDKPAENLLESAFNRLKLSARAYNRILKMARTIADLENESAIKPVHISEAIQYRMLDRTDQI